MSINNIIINQKGQALIIVLVTMVVALAAGIGISSRSINTFRRTTNVDSASRAIAVAEAGIESILPKDTDELNALVGGSTGCTTAGAPIQYSTNTAGTTDVEFIATITPKRYGCQSPGQSYTYEIKKDEIIEIKLENVSGSGNELNFCWRSPSPAKSSLYIMQISGDGTDSTTYGYFTGYKLKKNGYNQGNSNVENKFTSINNVVQGKYCLNDYPLDDKTQMLRILSLYDTSEVTITNKSDNNITIPYQGWELRAIGSTKVGATNEVKKVVTAYKSRPFLPGIFNFGIFAENSSIQ